MKVKVDNDKLFVFSPYDEDFIRRAKQIGGKWNATERAWVFPLSAEKNVRELLLDIYDVDGTDTSTCTVRVHLDHLYLGSELQAGGRVLLKKYNRDTAPRCGDGVMVISGELYDRGGSRRNPEITHAPGTVIEVKDFPLQAAKRLVERDPEAWEIVEVDDPQPEPETEAPDEQADPATARLLELVAQARKIGYEGRDIDIAIVALERLLESHNR